MTGCGGEAYTTLKVDILRDLLLSIFCRHPTQLMNPLLPECEEVWHGNCILYGVNVIKKMDL